MIDLDRMLRDAREAQERNAERRRWRNSYTDFLMRHETDSIKDVDVLAAHIEVLVKRVRELKVNAKPQEGTR